MKQAIREIVNLKSLVLDTEKLPESESDLETFGRSQYSDLFLTNARSGYHLLHDGEQVRFSRGRFKHAFSKADDWQSSSRKTSLDRRRIIRIKWILPIIQGNAPGVECWLVKDGGQEKRAYICFGLGYIVWLEKSDEGQWEFSTAYTANPTRLREYIAGGKKIWKYGQ